MVTKMSYKVEQLLERPDVKENIVESLKKTKETRKEHVFNFCIRKEKTVITDIEEGEQHTVGAESKCPLEDAEVIGAFHTHTRLTKDEDVVPSPRDILKSTEDGLEFFCIGGNKGEIGIVRCFNTENLLLEMNEILELTNKPMTGENIQRASRHVVGRMLSEKSYLNQLSYTRLYKLE